MGTGITLTSAELRIIGCLMEKAVTTPDQYPLTLNALTSACNQKSSRNPVMSLDQGTVQRTARQLEGRTLLSSTEGKSHVLKYTQRLCNTLLAELQFDEAEYAVITLLLLRGPQTPGELKARSGRLYTFADNEEVTAVLSALIGREGGAVVARLPRRAGRKDHEYTHLFAGEVESVAEEEAPAQRSAAHVQKSDSIARLEARIARLEHALLTLAERVGEKIELDSDTDAE